MPENFCKTFIHRFDSDRRLQSDQQLRDTHKFSEKLTVVKNVVSCPLEVPDLRVHNRKVGGLIPPSLPNFPQQIRIRLGLNDGNPFGI